MFPHSFLYKFLVSTGLLTELHSPIDAISLWRKDVSYYTTNFLMKCEALLHTSVLYKNLEIWVSQEEGINLHCPETTSLQSALIRTPTISKSKKNAPSSANILLCPYALLVSECHQGHSLECHTVHSWWAKSLDSLSLQLYECHRVLVTQADCINSANTSTCSIQHNSAKICI